MGKANKPFLPTLNSIRSATIPRGQDVAEGFDAIGNLFSKIASRITALETAKPVAVSSPATTASKTISTAASTPLPNPPQPVVPYRPPSFDQILSGDNETATMEVSLGAEIIPDPDAPGIIEATNIWALPIDPTPPTDPNMVLKTTGEGSGLLEGLWGFLGITGIDCETSTGIPLLLTTTGFLTRVDCDSPLVEGDFSIVFDCGDLSGLQP